MRGGCDQRDAKENLVVTEWTLERIPSPSPCWFAFDSSYSESLVIVNRDCSQIAIASAESSRRVCRRSRPCRGQPSAVSRPSSAVSSAAPWRNVTCVVNHFSLRHLVSFVRSFVDWSIFLSPSSFFNKASAVNAVKRQRGREARSHLLQFARKFFFLNSFYSIVFRYIRASGGFVALLLVSIKYLHFQRYCFTRLWYLSVFTSFAHLLFAPLDYYYIIYIYSINTRQCQLHAAIFSLTVLTSRVSCIYSLFWQLENLSHQHTRWPRNKGYLF